MPLLSNFGLRRFKIDALFIDCTSAVTVGHIMNKDAHAKMKSSESLGL